MSTLTDPDVAAELDRMYAEAGSQMATMRHRFDGTRFDGVDLQTASPQERADALSEVYLPVSPGAGKLLYSLVRACRPETVVEFGTSLGLSGIHLAAAVRDNGTGRVVTTELSAAKVAVATRNFAASGLGDLITVLEGDALQTLATVEGPIGFVLLDGWKEFYLPVIQLLEPRLSSGALIVADNTNVAETAPYVDYVRDPANGYVSSNLPDKEHDAMELSCRV